MIKSFSYIRNIPAFIKFLFGRRKCKFFGGKIVEMEYLVGKSKAVEEIRKQLYI